MQSRSRVCRRGEQADMIGDPGRGEYLVAGAADDGLIDVDDIAVVDGEEEVHLPQRRHREPLCLGAEERELGECGRADKQPKTTILTESRKHPNRGMGNSGSVVGVQNDQDETFQTV